MYVLTIGRSLPAKDTGMMGIFEFEQANALSKKGCKVVYAFCDTRSIKHLRKYGSYHKRLNDVTVFGYHLPIGGLPQKLFSKIKTWYFKKIMNNIVNEKGIPDILHIHFPLLTLTDEIWELLKTFNRPIVVTEHWTKVQTKELEPFRINLLKKIVKESKEFICVGEPLRKSVIELTDTNKSIKVIPNMVSPLFYYKGDSLLDEESTTHFEFITVGRLVEVKRFDIVIAAFTKAFKQDKNVKLTIVGGGPLYDKLKRQINDLGMSDRIVMAGFLSRKDTAEMIQRSNAFVSASVLETFGVPFIESMACGKPVIGVKNGPIDAYIDESNGILFEPDNIDDLKRALKQMYRNKKSYNAKQIAEKTYRLFSEDAVAEQLLKIFMNYTRIMMS